MKRYLIVTDSLTEAEIERKDVTGLKESKIDNLIDKLKDAYFGKYFVSDVSIEN